VKNLYRRAGVDQEAQDGLADWIAKVARPPAGSGVVAGIGGFAGVYEAPGSNGCRLLVACTDGVGTKLKIAFALGRHDTVGIDLVAMSVNDLICCGARPMFFLDYLAVGKLEPGVARSVLSGVVAGCREAGAVLLGGETAQMPDMYSPGEYDLAGFAVGDVERRNLLGPGSARGERMRAGDAVLGIASSGIHSNGYSLVRRIVEASGRKLGARIAGLNGTLGDELLRPTRIYERPLRRLLEDPQAGRHVRAVAHITGSGIPGNLPRVLSKNLAARLDRSSWPKPPIFPLLMDWGGIPQEEMYDVFNMGIGLIVVIARRAEEAAKRLLGPGGVYRIGEIVARPARGKDQVLWA